MRGEILRYGLIGLLLALFAVSAPIGWSPVALAQDEDEFEDDGVFEDEEIFEEEEDAEFGDEVEFEAIDDILAIDEEILSDPQTYSYDPGARRDPFRSLLRRKKARKDRGVRPDGIPGLLIDELRLEGIFELDDGPVAQVRSSNQRTSFLLRPGDQLWDGDVVRVTLDEIVYKQTVDDPTSIKPFREVVKKLDPSK